MTYFHECFQYLQDILSKLIPMHLDQSITMALSLPIFNVLIFSNQLPNAAELMALQLTNDILSVVVYAIGPIVIITFYSFRLFDALCALYTCIIRRLYKRSS